MRLPLSGRLIATVLIAAIACFLYVIDAGLTASFASEDDTASQEEEAPSLESLTEQIAALEARVMELEANQDELAAQELAYPVFDAIAAVYLMDQIDIHALYDQLHDGEGIMPGDAGPIKRLVPLLSAVDWPEELADEATALVETLAQLAEALADNDLESALPLAEAAHDEQHHFSRSVSQWFDKLMMPEEEAEQADQEQDGETESVSDGDSDDHSHDNGHDHGHDSDDDSDDDQDTHGHDDEDDSDDDDDDGHGHSH